VFAVNQFPPFLPFLFFFLLAWDPEHGHVYRQNPLVAKTSPTSWSIWATESFLEATAARTAEMICFTDLVPRQATFARFEMGAALLE
jgi:hypothetical protein